MRVGDGETVDFCGECCKPLKADEIYLWNGKSYCIVCVNIASARSE